MSRPEYFTIDPLAMNLRELVRSFGLRWQLLLFLLLKMLRRFSAWPPESAFRMPREFSDIEQLEADVPDQVRQSVQSATKELVALGFRKVAFHSFCDEVPEPSAYVLNLISPEGSAHAMIHVKTKDSEQAIKSHVDTTFCGITESDELIGVTNQRATFDPRPGTRITTLADTSPTELWKSFQSTFKDAGLKRMEADSLKHHILKQLQEQVRHFIVRGIFRLVTDDELEALDKKVETPQTPPPLPGQLPRKRELRRVRANQLRPPPLRRRLDHISKFAATSAGWMFFYLLYHDPSHQPEADERTFIFVLMTMVGFACACFFIIIMLDMLRVLAVSRASYSTLKRRLREPPVEMPEGKTPSNSQIVLQFAFGAVFWAVIIYTVLFF